MADAVATQTIQDDGNTAIFRFSNVSDGSGESAVTKIDVSALAVDPMTGAACTKVSIQKIYYSTIGMGVKIFFDASSDVLQTSTEGCIHESIIKDITPHKIYLIKNYPPINK